MIELEEITVERRDHAGRELEDLSERASTQSPNAKSRRRCTFNDPDLGQNPKKDGFRASVSAEPIDGHAQGAQPTQEDLRTQFYEKYRKEADEYDREFMKKHDEDLNTTLIFAGLFSAVTSAFIIEVDSQIQPDPNEETAALLRVILHKMDNTIFGDNVPTVPQWTGPPRTIVQVQSILFASLATSLFSAFLAMLGKQWLNRYASVDMRGSAIERSQNRQRKLDGIAAWYFDHVMESLPLMLQFALLLLGCALSHYLWGIDTTIASVVLGVTLSGVLFYFFIAIAGTAYESCPYQTPAARILRNLLSALHEGCSAAIRQSEAIVLLKEMGKASDSEPWWSRGNIVGFLEDVLRDLPRELARDGRHVAVATSSSFVGFAYRVCGRSASTTPTQTSDGRTIALDFHCISWMLQTSLDKTINLLTVKFLTTVLTHPDSNSTIASACLTVLIGCVNIIDDGVAVMTGESEQLGAVSATCFLSLYCSLSATNSGSTVLAAIRQRYRRSFPPKTDFSGLPFHFTMSVVHHLFNSSNQRRILRWDHYNPSTQEYISFSHTLVKVAQFEYQRRVRQKKVPRWLLRFALRSLSQQPLPSTSVVVDCLLIIAIDLDCDVSEVNDMILDESAQAEQVLRLITKKLVTMGQDPQIARSKGKAITAIFQYAARQEQAGALEAAHANSLKSTAIRVFPYVNRFWRYTPDSGDFVRLWMTTISSVPYTDDVGQCVVDTLLQLASEHDIRGYIVKDAWSWLSRRPPLPPACSGLLWGTTREVVQTVRALKDVEIFKSYLLLVWSEWDCVWSSGFDEMCMSIREDFSGIGNGGHCAELMGRLVSILNQFDLGFEYFLRADPRTNRWSFQRRMEQYLELLKVALEVYENVEKNLAECHSTFMCALPLPCP